MVKINKDFIQYIDNNEASKINLNNYFCTLYDYNQTTKELKIYYDNINLFFRDISSDSNLIFEIFALLIYLFMHTIINFSQMVMLKRLDAIILLVNNNFNYFFGRIIFMTLIKTSEENYLTIELFLLLEFEEFISMLAYMIYMEIIQIKFCGLDHDIKKNIRKRGEYDYNEALIDIDNEDEFIGELE